MKGEKVYHFPQLFKQNQREKSGQKKQGERNEQKKRETRGQAVKAGVTYQISTAQQVADSLTGALENY